MKWNVTIIITAEKGTLPNSRVVNVKAGVDNTAVIVSFTEKQTYLHRGQTCNLDTTPVYLYDLSERSRRQSLVVP